jgi:hypothetical protein
MRPPAPTRTDAKSGRTKPLARQLCPWVAFSHHSSVCLCVKPFRADDWDLPTRQTGGFDEGGEHHPAVSADDQGHPSQTARAVPLLWRGNTHHRDLPSRAKAAVKGTATGAGRMMESPSFPSTRHRSLLRRRVAGACPRRRQHLDMDRFRYDQTAGTTAISARCFRSAS